MSGRAEIVTAADGHEFDAYFADEPNKPKGLVIVVQEIFGVNDHIRSVVDLYGDLGYSAVAPSLFDRVQKNVELSMTMTASRSVVKLLLRISRLNKSLLMSKQRLIIASPYRVGSG